LYRVQRRIFNSFFEILLRLSAPQGLLIWLAIPSNYRHDYCGSCSLFKNSNLFIMNMDTQYDPAFAVDGAKIGSTLRIRLPNDYVVT
jgi:hypothetical protein